MTTKNPGKLLIPVTCLLLGACTTTPPNEPSVMVLPGTGKSFEQFRGDNEICKQFAYGQVSGRTAEGTGFASGVSSAAVGTVLGAAAGAAADGGRGASVGAGAGLALGGLSGAGAAETSAARLQHRYDIGYQQCMYAKGHRIPMAGGLANHFFRDYQERIPAPPPPPPPGTIIR
ncbi:MAG TPA: hypothetical protein VJ654_05260 [Noviherbaspirillum sp.]|nr:hypothetical protein [Noviherbaspirillum sp.]